MKIKLLTRRALGSAVFLSGFLLTACAATPRLADLPLASVAVQPQLELVETPFHPQEIHQCGPAALATVLGADGVTLTPEALAAEVYIPGREGSLQAELVAAVREHKRVAVRLAPHLESVLAPLREQRPVLVLQNLGFKRWPRWHYAVLVGWDAEANELILRSGSKVRERLSPARFLQTWDLAGRWAVIVADPLKTPPAAVKARDWIAAVAPFESLGKIEIASAAYESAVQRWPSEPLAWQALANVRYARADLSGAEQALESAIALEASPAALNNLAQIRIERGCKAAALKTLEQIGDVPPALAAAVSDTRAAALAMNAESSGHCD